MRSTALWLALALAHTPVVASGDERSDDLTTVLGDVLYPIQLMSYCWSEVEQDQAFLDAGRTWNMRNWELLANIEALGRAAGVSDASRRESDESSLVAITATVSGQRDRAAYCRTLARIVDEGYFDIDQREDLRLPLKRIFGVD